VPDFRYSGIKGRKMILMARMRILGQYSKDEVGTYFVSLET